MFIMWLWIPSFVTGTSRFLFVYDEMREPNSKNQESQESYCFNYMQM